MADTTTLGVAASAKKLAEENATAIEALKGGMKYKGAVEDYAHLPATGNKAGDVWSTLDDGCEYVWGNVGGTNQWIQLGTAAVEPLTDEEVDAAVGAELITVTVTNGTATGDTAIAGTATVTIVPNEGYILPQSVTVANATYTYNAETGVISLSEATDTVTISAECGAIPLATVTGLGSQLRTDVVFTKTDNFPTSFESWTDSNSNVFIKIPTMYRKVLASSNGQITSFAMSTMKIDDAYEPYPVFKNGNEILPYVCLGVYCYNSNNSAASKQGTPATLSIGKARTLASNIGTGYQQYDVHFQKLFVDLALLISQKVHFSYGETTENYLGVHNLNELIFVDGISQNGNHWIVAYDPTKYVDSPTGSTEGYSQLDYTLPTSNGLIKVLGYDTNHPFLNCVKVAEGNVSNTYYCDRYNYYSADPHAFISGIGINDSYYGLWYTDLQYSYTSSAKARLCYRPIAS